MSEWISVKDTLPVEADPRNPKPVITCGEDGTVFLAFYIDGCFALGDAEFGDITHWMPLPEPPKGGGMIKEVLWTITAGLLLILNVWTAVDNGMAGKRGWLIADIIFAILLGIFFLGQLLIIFGGRA